MAASPAFDATEADPDSAQCPWIDMNIWAALKPLAGVRVPHRHNEEGGSSRNEHDVEHGALPFESAKMIIAA